MARVVLARRARDELLELNWPLIDAIQEAVGRLKGLRSLHVVTYRIIYQLADGEQTVRVVAIRHRSIAYGNDPR